MYTHTFILRKPHGHRKHYKDVLMFSFKQQVLDAGFTSANVYWNGFIAKHCGKANYELDVAPVFKELPAWGRVHRKIDANKHEWLVSNIRFQ